MMILGLYARGLLKSASLWPMLVLIYVLNLLMALLLAVPFFVVSGNIAGNSLLPGELFPEFSFTAVMEWLREAGNVPGTFFIMAVCIAVVYYLSWIFLSGGIVESLNRSRFAWIRFWHGCTRNFLRFSGISVIMLIIQVILTLIVFGVASAVIKGLQKSAESENEFAYWIVGAGILFLFFWLFWSAVSDYAKFYLVKNNSYNPFGALYRAFIFGFSHFFKVYGLRFLLFLTPLPVWYILWKAGGSVTGATLSGLMVLFLIRQLFIMVRIGFRVWVYSSQLKMFSVYYPGNKQINIGLRRRLKAGKKAERIQEPPHELPGT